MAETTLRSTRTPWLWIHDCTRDTHSLPCHWTAVNFSALAMELLQSCTKSLTWYEWKECIMSIQLRNIHVDEEKVCFIFKSILFLYMFMCRYYSSEHIEIWLMQYKYNTPSRMCHSTPISKQACTNVIKWLMPIYYLTMTLKKKTFIVYKVRRYIWISCFLGCKLHIYQWYYMT